MKFSVAAATLVSLLPAVLGLTINTPSSVVQCQPVLLSWAAGTPPYYLSLIPAGQVSAPALLTFPTQNGTSLTWIVNEASGTTFNVAVKDSTGTVAYTDIVTVQPGTDSSCLGGSSGLVSSTTGAGTPTSTGGSGNSGNSSPASGGTGTSSKTSSTSSPSSGGSNTGDASGLAFSSFGIAGVIGAVAALF